MLDHWSEHMLGHSLHPIVGPHVGLLVVGALVGSLALTWFTLQLYLYIAFDGCGYQDEARI
jgi:hypothetical protein